MLTFSEYSFLLEKSETLLLEVPWRHSLLVIEGGMVDHAYDAIIQALDLGEDRSLVAVFRSTNCAVLQIKIWMMRMDQGKGSPGCSASGGSLFI